MQFETTPGDVGGWFRTALDRPVALPHTPSWGPGTDGFGLVSPAGDIDAAAQLFAGRPTLVLTGAGMSTDSGLPDYRGPGAVPRSPMTYQEFVGSDLSRRRYWARSTVGWGAFAAARPNAAHLALADLGRLTPIVGVVTQNVDGLHQAAGSSPVVDLHGTLARVVCLGCGDETAREELQHTLLRMNPGFAARLDTIAAEVRNAPDGDAEVDTTHDFTYPDCRRCGGMLKPDVVYFGENAPPHVTARAHEMLDAADALLVLGTSLSVMSGLRFLRRSARDGRPVVLVNDGATRGDDLATARIHGRLAPVLRRWIELLSP
ncbi:MAG: NAD-dependent protein deacetylase [Arachnia sp.]